MSVASRAMDIEATLSRDGTPHDKINSEDSSAFYSTFNTGHTGRVTKENSLAEVRSRTLGDRTASLYLGRSTTNAPTKVTDISQKSSQATEEKPQSHEILGSKQHTTVDDKKEKEENASDHEEKVRSEIEDILRARYEVVYVESCKRLGIIPVSYITKRLCDAHITMRSHGLGPEGAKAIAVALVNNERVESLDVTDNWIGEDGASYLAEMMSENIFITDLNLSENLIGSKGIRDLCDVVKGKECLRTLNLSGTGIKDTDSKCIAEVIENNLYLKELYLNHNEIGADGGKFIGKALRRNGTLQVLDLSWNHLRRQGAILFSKGIQENCGLRHLDISWNGFGVEGSKALAKALEKNFTLTHLDLSSNRLHTEAITFLLNGLRKNDGLISLRLAYNPITPETAFAILTTIYSLKESPLSDVDMSDIVVDIQFVNLLRALRDERSITVSHGPCISKQDASANNKDATTRGAADPRDIMFEFMNKDALRSVDFFKRIDKSGKGAVSKKKFKEGIVAMEIPLTTAQLENLVEMLDKDKTGLITVKDLNNEERAYKRKMHALKRKRAKLAAMKKAEAEKDSDDDDL